MSLVEPEGYSLFHIYSLPVFNAPSKLSHMILKYYKYIVLATESYASCEVKIIKITSISETFEDSNRRLQKPINFSKCIANNHKHLDSNYNSV